MFHQEQFSRGRATPSASGGDSQIKMTGAHNRGRFFIRKWEVGVCEMVAGRHMGRPLVRLRACMDREVKVLSRHALSGL